MAGVGRDKGFVQNQGSVLETRFDIPYREPFGCLTHRQPPFLGLGKLGLSPFELLDLGQRRHASAPCVRWRGEAHPDVALFPRVRRAWPERVQRVDVERQPLVVYVDSFDGFGGRELIHRGDRQNRLALVDRLHRQPALAQGVGPDHYTQVGDGIRRSRQIVHGENRPDSGHGQRGAGVDVPYTRVRHRTQQQLGKQHALGTIVLGVLRLPGHLRHQVRCRVVLADQLVVWMRRGGCGLGHGYALLESSAPRISALRILV